ncbi:Clathrin adaptor complex small chain family protein, putative isoform 1 [Theobroma cacao]|uniref:AP complex subunit sigma n=1 Tax=Theobroma cacao TaxID=3641 RepID=A0A061DF82_THECC|nr:Clathrin adaptor complex small chain family protein, putative isoform 1 [Theobroma cacao]
MVMNTHGKPRLAKFYEYLWKSSRSLHEAFLRVPISYQHSSSSSSSSYFSFLCCRAENVSNFIEAESIFGPDSRLLYKHFATLDFVVVYSSEIELAVLDLIQVFVEMLDKCFKNVCKLDIVFNYSKVIEDDVFGKRIWGMLQVQVSNVT